MWTQYDEPSQSTSNKKRLYKMAKHLETHKNDGGVAPDVLYYEQWVEQVGGPMEHKDSIYRRVFDNGWMGCQHGSANSTGILVDHLSTTLYTGQCICSFGYRGWLVSKHSRQFMWGHEYSRMDGLLISLRVVCVFTGLIQTMLSRLPTNIAVCFSSNSVSIYRRGWWRIIIGIVQSITLGVLACHCRIWWGLEWGDVTETVISLRCVRCCRVMTEVVGRGLMEWVINC